MKEKLITALPLVILYVLFFFFIFGISNKAHAAFTQVYVDEDTLPWSPLPPVTNYGFVGNGIGSDFEGLGIETITAFGGYASYTGTDGSKPLAVQLSDGVDWLDCISDFKHWSEWGLSTSPDLIFFDGLSGSECSVTLGTGSTLIYWVEAPNDEAESGDGTNQLEYWSNTPSGIYMALYSGGQTTSSSTQIVSMNAPSNPRQLNVVTDNTSVNFDVDYISNYPVPSRICVEISNLTVFQTLTPECEDILSSGFLTFSTTTTLVSRHQYSWRAVIWDSDNQIIDVTELAYFTVEYPPVSGYNPDYYGNTSTTPSGISTSTSLSDLTLECDPNDNFFSRSICNMAILLFVPSQASLNELNQNINQLYTKQPFSAFAEFRNGWNNAVRNPTVNPSTLTLVLYGENVDIISTSTLSSVAGDNSLSTLRYIIAVGLWIAFGWFAFHRVTKFF